MTHLSKQIVLKKREERRIASGHPWLFSNEIAEVRGDPAVGDIVEVRSAGGLTLGTGFYHPHSLISVRLLSPSIVEIGKAFFEKRISEALELRRSVYPEEQTFRVVHGESDFLPGLVIDKYNEYLAVQTFSYGMDSRLPLICDVLEMLFRPRGIVERNESPLRILEQLPQKKGVLRGTVEQTIVQEHNLLYAVDLLAGQKTGLFLDQKENRLAVRRFSRGARVLDCFCNDGGFALNAARGGAASVLAVDSSHEAIRNANQNAASNKIDTVQFVQADVFEKLTELRSEAELFNLVILDPPSFTRSKKTVTTAKKGYRELNAQAMRVLKKGGILVTASCSHHIEPEVFMELVHEAARITERSLQLLEWRGASADHPTLPVVPETRYLKLGIFRIL